MIKHIFTDLDGTLLASDGTLSSGNVAKILASQLPVTLVSARAPMEMAFVLKALKLTDWQVAFNGGLVYAPTPQGLQILEEKYLTGDLAGRLITLIQIYFPQVSLSFYDLEHWYTASVDAGILYEAKITGQTPTIIQPTEFFQTGPHKIFKIMLITFDSEELQRLQYFLTALELKGITIQQSGTAYLEITHEAAQKSAGLAVIMAKEKLGLEETAAFGDGHNDLPMLKMVGWPIAMANAQKEVQKVAKFVTTSNNEDGVGAGIWRYLL